MTDGRPQGFLPPPVSRPVTLALTPLASLGHAPAPATSSEVDRQRGARGAGPFLSVSSRTRRASFPRTSLSGGHDRMGVVARPAWMSSWHRRQITRVLRRRMAMRCIQAGFSRRPGLLRSASLRMWWTSRPAGDSQISQRPARSRWISSLRRELDMTGRWSVRTAVRTRLSGIPPKRATSGFLPRSRSTVTWKTLRGPVGDSILVLYFRAILLTVLRCFPASVFSIEVSITHWRRLRRNTSWAKRWYWTNPAYSEPYLATMVKSLSR